MNNSNQNNDQKHEIWFSTSITDKIVTSLGLPGGLLYSSENENFRGFVRNKGKTIELSQEIYSLWIQLLRPQVMKTLYHVWRSEKISVGNIISNMEKAELVIVLDGLVEPDYEKISKLRPLPIGMSWTSNEKDRDLTTIVSGEGNPKLALSPLAFTLWSLCDYTNSIADIFKKIVSMYNLDHNLIKKTMLETFSLLMDNRLMFADIGDSEVTGESI